MFLQVTQLESGRAGVRAQAYMPEWAFLALYSLKTSVFKIKSKIQVDWYMQVSKSIVFSV